MKINAVILKKNAVILKINAWTFEKDAVVLRRKCVFFKYKIDQYFAEISAEELYQILICKYNLIEKKQAIYVKG